jgi:hypothetical protein
MSTKWVESLQAYRYPVDLKTFEDANEYPGWFNFNTHTGDRESTLEFETYFRTHARQAIESWLEVVYWKIYNQPSTRRNIATRRVAAHFMDSRIVSQALWDSCHLYIGTPTIDNLNSFRDLLGLKSKSIALALTYPAFLRPDMYPMVDTRVAKWVAHSMKSHNAADNQGPQLTRSRFVDSKQAVLATNDFSFVQDWTRWCRHIARKLTLLTSIEWRPRDVEMAVFNAWGGRHDKHPKIELEPLGPIPK